MRMAIRMSTLLMILGILAGRPALAEPFTSYRIVATRPAGDSGTSWDHLSIDEANRHVFIGRGVGGLMVVDADTGAPIGTIPETAGSHGAAIADDLGVGFSDNGKGGKVTVFDLASLKPRAQFNAGDN